MKDRLPFFTNTLGVFSEYKVETQEVNREGSGGEESYAATVTTFVGYTESKPFEIFSIHTDRMTFWDERQTEILRQITAPLNDFTAYRWNEIKQPLIEYWLDKQELAERQQREQGAKTVWKPGGNYALWRFMGLITHVLIAKYSVLNDGRILDEIKKYDNAFEEDFCRTILEPVSTYAQIKHIRDSESDQKLIAEKIVDCIIEMGRNRAGIYQDILDPDFKADSHFLNTNEERELNSLFALEYDIRSEIESNSKLNKIEQRSLLIEFWDTPQGRRLSELNSRRVLGGGLKFEEVEKLKRERLSEILEDLETVLDSWSIDRKFVEHGLQYFQNLYEHEMYKRTIAEQSYKLMLEESRLKLEGEKAILSGIWDDSSLNFIGILVGIAVGFGLSIASFAESNKLLWGVASAVLSFIAFTLLFKWNRTKKPLLRLSQWVLRDNKNKKPKAK